MWRTGRVTGCLPCGQFAEDPFYGDVWRSIELRVKLRLNLWHRVRSWHRCEIWKHPTKATAERYRQNERRIELRSCYGKINKQTPFALNTRAQHRTFTGYSTSMDVRKTIPLDERVFYLQDAVNHYQGIRADNSEYVFKVSEKESWFN